LKFDAKIKNLIYKEGIDDEYGARPLKRCIEGLVSTPLALALLKEEIDPNAVVKVSAKKDKAVFTFLKSIIQNSKIEIPPFPDEDLNDGEEMTMGV
jgi:ATP-dependent Clp protease ATP-binding subunit ClpA